LAIVGGVAAAVGHGPAQVIPGPPAKATPVVDLYTLSGSAPSACLPASSPPSALSSASTSSGGATKPWSTTALTGPVNGKVGVVSPDLSTAVVAVPTASSALQSPGVPPAGSFVPELVDTTTGSVVGTGPALASSQLVLAGGALWGVADGSPLTLCSLDPATLNVLGQVLVGNLPWSPTSSVPGSGPVGSVSPFTSVANVVLAGTPDGGLWVGDASGGQTTTWGLLRFDVSSGDLQAETGATLAPSTLGTLSVDPTGNDLYVTLSSTNGTVATGSAKTPAAPATGAVTLLELDAHTGGFHASRTLSNAVGTARVTAVTGGVWLSYNTPSVGGTVPFAAAGLVQGNLVDPGSLSAGTTTFLWQGSTNVVSAGDTMWISTAQGELSCVDPRSGVIRSSEHLASGQAPIPLGVDTQSRDVLVQEPSGQLATLIAPAHCWG
jgi:hypothetical protein